MFIFEKESDDTKFLFRRGDFPAKENVIIIFSLSFHFSYNATVLAYGQTGSGKTYTMGTGFELAQTVTASLLSLIHI